MEVGDGGWGGMFVRCREEVNSGRHACKELGGDVLCVVKGLGLGVWWRHGVYPGG